MFRPARMQRVLNHGLGLQYDYDLGGDNMDAWVQHQINLGNLVSCGCGHGGHKTRSSGFGCGHPTRSSASSCSPSPVKVPSADDDTERKGRQLQESKKEKARAEKNKKKKLKQKERKQRERLKKEKQKNEKKDKDDNHHDDDEDDDDDDDDAAAQQSGNKDRVHAEGAGGRGKELAARESQESSQSEPESSDEDDDDDSSISEELDMTSSFVSKAALIVKRQLEQKPKALKVEKKRVVVEKEECKTEEERTSEEQEAEHTACAAPCGPSFEDIIKISTDLAVIGNQCASTGDYVTAVRYFTDAIKYNPTEFKLFGNRSLCFEKMQEYEKALADAELSLGICPGWVKGLFRKGRALAGLKRYDEAASALKEVLKLDRSCAEAAQELMRIQIIQLMACGFTREQSSNALIIHGTVEKASEVLSQLNHMSGGAHHAQTLPTVQVANVNGVSPILSATTKLSPGGAARPSSPRTQTSDPSRTSVSNQPAHPFQSRPPELFPVWVGNLDYTVTEACLTNLFNAAGTVCSVRMLTNRRCAFINFTKQEFSEQAIQRFNGYNLNGIRLVVRYPDRIPPGMGISASAHRASHQQLEYSFQRKSQAGSRRPV